MRVCSSGVRSDSSLSRVCDMAATSAPVAPARSKEAAREKFMSVFDRLRSDVISDPLTRDLPAYARQWIQEVRRLVLLICESNTHDPASRSLTTMCPEVSSTEGFPSSILWFCSDSTRARLLTRRKRRLRLSLDGASSGCRFRQLLQRSLIKDCNVFFLVGIFPCGRRYHGSICNTPRPALLVQSPKGARQTCAILLFGHNLGFLRLA